MITTCLLATLPLALKVKVYRSLAQVDISRETKVVAFLAKHEFEAVKDRASDPQYFLIHAGRGACTMDLREVSPRGYDRAAIQALAAARRLIYVDNGAVSPEQPAWRTWLYFHFRRLAWFFGWPLPRRLTFAVISSGSCARSRLVADLRMS